MNKSDLVELVTGKLPNLTARDIEMIVNIIFGSMTDALSKDDRIEIRGFGSFEVRVRKARKGRNPKTGESVELNVRRVPFFKVGKELKELVNK
ncbi:MAG: integration host factor subunit beta [Deltaproteobacteria bacterium CG11_big_fil_rev_8_21_14_0_20_49_13]|nr:MAG: integration host factor subunit beta [Deltaproteobacteria bacterium CG11_big_fil_rev_8_21_14_0_20_49_13]